MVIVVKRIPPGTKVDIWNNLPSIVTIDQIMTCTRLWPFFCSVQQWPTPKASIKFIKSFHLLMYLFIYSSFYYGHHPPFMPSLLWKAELQHSPYEFRILTGAFWQFFFQLLHKRVNTCNKKRYSNPETSWTEIPLHSFLPSTCIFQFNLKMLIGSIQNSLKNPVLCMSLEDTSVLFQKICIPTP